MSSTYTYPPKLLAATTVAWWHSPIEMPVQQNNVAGSITTTHGSIQSAFCAQPISDHAPADDECRLCPFHARHQNVTSANSIHTSATTSAIVIEDACVPSPVSSITLQLLLNNSCVRLYCLALRNAQRWERMALLQWRF